MMEVLLCHPLGRPFSIPDHLSFAAHGNAHDTVDTIKVRMQLSATVQTANVSSINSTIGAIAYLKYFLHFPLPDRARKTVMESL